MIDITGKEIVYREAIAEGIIKLKPDTVRRIREGRVEKGDVLTVSRIAAIQAVKKTPDLIPLCHNIPITHVDVDYEFIDNDKIKVVVKVKTTAKTGVEMEALTGVSTALLNIWDMVKKYEKDENGQYPETWIEKIRVVSKIKKKI
ncbi:cyclic pyranopterin monophosphate synthase MoaC [Staphylothermus hellenicus]|uniref:Probable cyclic pyranopterin monophosphate synthase n=1 Tax=Staphylothermus hellenicus (strain DSM 12710 / JCM 10830 / BK20S6-10-b1 / P8) TaxID=591019 RepID=D7D835_STAHD|nr:cyclic pyranopterin monophosphate synthase MoaC [Staphylothermus hellenicus]ADI31931.1 molybdenum cofactor biosynthesis protein C [Staphylothermus hellenicus DSM 12710]